MADSQHASIPFRLSEMEHKYGEHAHLIANPFLLSHLSKLCENATVQPTVNRLVTILYRELLQAVVNNEFPRRNISVPTRMIQSTEKGVYEGEVIDRSTRVVTVNIARAGALPSQVAFDALNEFMDPAGIRQDHFIMARTVDDKKRVTGASIGASKIGGPVDNQIVLFPDPMGATGSSMSAAIETYKEKVPGKPSKLISLNLIVTPEYLRRLKDDHPDALVYALRLDRGMSEDAVLGTVPGTFWDREKGLDDQDYIVPGAGGLGEVINNSWV